jgi:hypothetical protein
MARRKRNKVANNRQPSPDLRVPRSAPQRSLLRTGRMLVKVGRSHVDCISPRIHRLADTERTLWFWFPYGWITNRSVYTRSHQR